MFSTAARRTRAAARRTRAAARRRRRDPAWRSRFSTVLHCNVLSCPRQVEVDPAPQVVNRRRKAGQKNKKNKKKCPTAEKILQVRFV